MTSSFVFLVLFPQHWLLTPVLCRPILRVGNRADIPQQLFWFNLHFTLCNCTTLPLCNCGFDIYDILCGQSAVYERIVQVCNSKSTLWTTDREPHSWYVELMIQIVRCVNEHLITLMVSFDQNIRHFIKTKFSKLNMIFKDECYLNIWKTLWRNVCVG